MSPDTIESRVGRLEVGLATVRQQVHDLAKDVSDLEHIPVVQAQIHGSVEHVAAEIERLANAIEHVRRRMKQREETEHALRIKQLEDAARNRKQIWVGIGAVLASAIGTIGTIIGSAP